MAERKIVDDTHYIPIKRGNGILRREIKGARLNQRGQARIFADFRCSAGFGSNAPSALRRNMPAPRPMTLLEPLAVERHWHGNNHASGSKRWNF